MADCKEEYQKVHANNIYVRSAHCITDKAFFLSFLSPNYILDPKIGTIAFLYIPDCFNEGFEYMVSFSNDRRDKKKTVRFHKVLENHHPQKRRIHERPSKTVFRHSLDREEMPQKHGMSRMESAEMN